MHKQTITFLVIYFSSRILSPQVSITEPQTINFHWICSFFSSSLAASRWKKYPRMSSHVIVSYLIYLFPVSQKKKILWNNYYTRCYPANFFPRKVFRGWIDRRRSTSAPRRSQGHQLTKTFERKDKEEGCNDESCHD